MKNILFLCRYNAGRSILAEAIANACQDSEYRAWSAGEEPQAEIHPMAAALLQAKGMSLEGLRSKSWREFIGEDAPCIDLAITLCNNLVGEMCMPLTGIRNIAHWDTVDPGQAATPEDRRIAFDVAFNTLSRNIHDLNDLPDYKDQRLVAATNRIGWANAIESAPERLRAV